MEPVTSKFVANVTRHEEFRFNSLLHRLSMSRHGAPLQEGASGDPIFVDFFRFSQFYPNSKDPDRKMARAPLHFFGTVAFVFGYDLLQAAPQAFSSYVEVFMVIADCLHAVRCVS